MSSDYQDSDEEFENSLNAEDYIEDDEDEFEDWLSDQIEIKAKMLTVQPKSGNKEYDSWQIFKEGSQHLNQHTTSIRTDIRETETFVAAYDELIDKKTTYTSDSLNKSVKMDQNECISKQQEFGQEYLSLKEEERSAVSTALKGVISAVVAMFDDTNEINDEIEQTNQEDENELSLQMKQQMKELDEKLRVQQEAAKRMMEDRNKFDEKVETNQKSHEASVEASKVKLAVESSERNKLLESILQTRKKEMKEMEIKLIVERTKTIKEEEEKAKENARLLKERNKEMKLFVTQSLAAEILQLFSKKHLFKIRMHRRIEATKQRRKQHMAAVIITTCLIRKIYLRNRQINQEKMKQLKIEKEAKEIEKRRLEVERLEIERKNQVKEMKKMQVEERKSKILEVQRKIEVEERKKRLEIENMRRKLKEEEIRKKEIAEKKIQEKKQKEEDERIRIEKVKENELRLKRISQEKTQEVMKQRKRCLIQWRNNESQRLSQWERNRQETIDQNKAQLLDRRVALGGMVDLQLFKQHYQEVERKNHEEDEGVEEEEADDDGYVSLNATECEMCLFGDSSSTSHQLEGMDRIRKEHAEQHKARSTVSKAEVIAQSSQPHPDDPRAALRQQLADAETRRRALIMEALSSTPSAQASSSTSSPSRTFEEWRGPSRLARVISARQETLLHIKKVTTQDNVTSKAQSKEQPKHFDDDSKEQVQTAEEESVLDAVSYIGLGDLKRVTQLDLDVESLEGGLSALKTMASLTSLSLSVNKVTHLEDSGLLTLGSTSRQRVMLSNKHKTKNQIQVLPLKRLCLRDNRIRSLEGLGEAFFVDGLADLSVDVNALRQIESSHLNPLSSSLISFSASANQISQWPEGLNLIKLNSLNFSHNKITYLPSSSFHHLPSLTSLDLGRNELTVASGLALSAAKCLTSLVLSRNKLKEVPFPLRLPLLRKLWLGSNRISSLELWAHSSRKKSVSRPSSSLASSRSPVRDGDGAVASAVDATWLPCLEYLCLENNAICDLSAGCFVGFPNLQNLDLSLNTLSVTDFETSLRGLWMPSYSTSNLLILNLKENPLAELLPEPLLPLNNTDTTQASTVSVIAQNNTNPTVETDSVAMTPDSAAAAPTAQAAPHVIQVPDWENPLLALLCARVKSLKMVDGHLLGPCRGLLAGTTDAFMKGRGAALIKELTNYDTRHSANKLLKRASFVHQKERDSINNHRDQAVLAGDIETMNEEELAMMLDEHGVGKRLSHSSRARRSKRRREETTKTQLSSSQHQKQFQVLRRMWDTKSWRCTYCGGTIQSVATASLPHQQEKELSNNLSKSESLCSQCGSRHAIPPFPSLKLLNILRSDATPCCGCAGADCTGECIYSGVMSALQDASAHLERLQQKHHSEEGTSKTSTPDSENELRMSNEIEVPCWLEGTQAVAWKRMKRKEQQTKELHQYIMEALQTHCLDLNETNGNPDCIVKCPGWNLFRMSESLLIEEKERDAEKRKEMEILIKKQVEQAKSIIAISLQKTFRGSLARRWWKTVGKSKLRHEHSKRRQACSGIQRVWRGRRVRKQLASALASAIWVDPEVDALLSGGGLSDMTAFFNELKNDNPSSNLVENSYQTPSKAWQQKKASPQRVEKPDSNIYGDGDFTAYDDLGPSVSRQQSRITSAASSDVSEVSLHSAHWGKPDTSSSKEFRLPPTKGAIPIPVRSSPIETSRSSQSKTSSLPAISPGGRTLSARERDEEAATKKVMSEWGLANPNVAATVLMRQEHIKRGEKEAAQREKDADPVYRYHRLMRKVAQNGLDAERTPREQQQSKKKGNQKGTRTMGRGKGESGGGGGGGGGGWGMRSSVAQDRARNMKKKKHNLTPAAWMPPIDK